MCVFGVSVKDVRTGTGERCRVDAVTQSLYTHSLRRLILHLLYMFPVPAGELLKMETYLLESKNLKIISSNSSSHHAGGESTALL